jgi:hypothetical protein
VSDRPRSLHEDDDTVVEDEGVDQVAEGGRIGSVLPPQFS